MMTNISRRTFIKGSGLVIAVSIINNSCSMVNLSGSAKTPPGFKPHAFLEILPDNTIIIWVGQTELGQGTHTGIAMIIAEELEADWKQIRVKQALAADAFKNPQIPMQFTGGSTSLRHRWDILRTVGAAAREMLVKAASVEWDIPHVNCRPQMGKIIHPDGSSLSYGILGQKAAKLPVPKDPQLKGESDYQVIGSKKDRLDIPDKVQGRPVYGIDVVVPDMCVAVIARPPAFGATPLAYNADRAKAVKGVIAVIALEDKIAVAAKTTYDAMIGRDALDVKWSAGSYPKLDDKIIDKWYKDQLALSGVEAESVGDAPKAIKEAAVTLEAEYQLPYLAHAMMEPTNCTAHVEKSRCRIWVPTQGQTMAQNTAAQITGLPAEKIEVMTTYCGGGFGRRIETEVTAEAVTLSKELNRPVKVMWTREDEFRHDVFRPKSICHIQAALDEDNEPIAWIQKIASPSIMSRIFPDSVKNGIDDTSVEGVTDMDYSFANKRVEYVKTDLPVPVGFWRSVGNSINTFTVESFMDELAAAAETDPLKFRLKLMERGSRARRTLRLLEEKSDWGKFLPSGIGKGLAVRTCFGSTAAHYAEVSVDQETGTVKIHKIICAFDCGPTVFPDAIKAQVQGATIMALSTAFHEKIQFENGGVKTANFNDYPMLSMTEVPPIEVHLAESRDAIGGVGEPGLPPVAPAVANAIFDAVGVRLRSLPFDKNALKITKEAEEEK